MEEDSGWEYNAPQFVDFTGGLVSEDEENVDEYFDYDHENGVPVKHQALPDFAESVEKTVTPQHQVIQADKIHTPSPRVTRSGKVLTPNTVEKHYEAVEKKKQAPKNICTNLDEWRKKTNAAKTAQNSKEPVKDTKPVLKRQHRSLERSESLPKRQRPVVVDRSRTPNKPQASRLARSNTFSTVNKSCNEKQRNHTRGLSGDREQKRTRSRSTNSDTEKAVTIPTTPNFLKQKPVKMQPHAALKNSEQLEMEKISYFRQELAKKRKLAMESCKVALSGKAPACVVHSKEVTKPEGFTFETDSRIKTHTMETRHDTDEKDFVRSLRSDKGKPTSSATKHTITVAEPFKLSTQRKRKLPDLEEKQAEKYESMAEKLAQFTKTPDRFRSKSKGPTDQKRGRCKIPMTVPKTPQFETRTRSRPVTAPTREDLEKKEVEEMQKNQFKAKPFKPEIFKNSSLGVKKVPTKPPTVTEEFHLSSKHRHHDHDKEKTEEQFHFHAQPVNKKILKGTVGVKEPKKLPFTVPESPAFALKHRARIPVVEEPKEERPTLRYRPAPHVGIPFQPERKHKATEPEPFGFEEREKRRAEEKKKKIEQALEEEKRQREFHANPIPDLEPHLPPKKKHPLTVKQPFNLDTDNRGARKAEEWSRKINEELEHQKEVTKFKARNPTVLEQDPFVPHKENKYTTADFSEFEFNTAKRTVKREAFEIYKKAKQDELDNIRIQERRMKEAEERAEFERMRKEAVHKANPIKQYKQMEIKRSDKMLTAPMSPHFQTDTRLRTRAMHAESFMSS